MYIYRERKEKGDKTVPCGVPMFLLIIPDDNVGLCLTNSDLEVRYALILGS